MSYGHFSEDGKEYIITRPDTPTPWINYLGDSEYCAMISNTAGGYSFHLDPRDRRVLRYRYNNLPADRPGRYFYIRDKETGEYWSPPWQPVPKDLSSYECRHGLGYTVISSTYQGVEAEATYFVPLGENLEVWMLKLKNATKRAKELIVFSYAEFCLWQATGDQTDLQYRQGLAEAKLEDGVIFFCLHDLSTGYAYFASSGKVNGFDCSREKFVGRYRSESNPAAVERGKCFNSVAKGGNPVAATSNMVKLGPGDTETIIFILGVAKEKPDAGKSVLKFRNKAAVDAELKKLKEHWSNFLGSFVADTPDKDFDLTVNVWNPYQCRTTFDWSRYVSLYETGIGRGMGFRDSNQDTLGVVHAFPERVRQRLLDLAKNQFESGKAYHIYYPITGEGGYPDYAKPQMMFFSDDHLWLVLATCEYIKETGDIAVLKEEAKFVDGSKASLYEHLKRAIKFTLDNMGSHGFPLLGTADWNDPLNIPGPNFAAETVWVAMFLHKALLELVELSKEYGQTDDARKFATLADKTKAHINETAWDGEWYIRAYSDAGNPVGSTKCKEGKIFLNTQSWAVFSRIAPEDRAVQCMDSAKEHLDTEYGLKLLAPAFSKYDPEIGSITSYVPGLKENASIWCHANAWAVLAECMLGRGDQAFEYFMKLAPPTTNRRAEVHGAEPYVYSQTVAGKDHPDFGWARQSWLTGTAAWMMKVATNWILGVRPQYQGLLIDPCVPKAWERFEVTRRFRGAVYDIKVENPNHVSKGVMSVTLDGKLLKTNLLPVLADGKEHTVKVTMG